MARTASHGFHHPFCRLQEVIKEVRIEVPKIVHVPVEVIKEVPIEIIKYVDREVSRCLLRLEWGEELRLLCSARQSPALPGSLSDELPRPLAPRR